jgi:3-phenylpropionate/trans-cinnamate dioxygenase ferredoxin subunit
VDGFARVASTDEIKEGEISEHAAGDLTFCVARSAGTVFAFAASCTHQECPLVTAYLEGPELECECHGARFDLATGAVTLPPASEDLPTYPVREIDGEVWVGIDAAIHSTS